MKEIHRVFKKILILLVLGSLWLVACGQSKLQIGWVGTSTADQIGYRYETFTGMERTSIRLTADQTLALTYTVEVDKGSLTLELQSPDGDTLWQELFEETDSGETVTMNASESGTYMLVIQGEKTGGSFNVTWDIE